MWSSWGTGCTGLLTDGAQIKFDWDRNYWIYDMASIEGTLSSQGSANPTDLSFLTTQLRSLPSEARRYLLWAALLGETCVLASRLLVVL